MERVELAGQLGAARSAAAPGEIVVEEREPAQFMRALGEAVAGNGTVLVADPSWGAAEKAQFTALREVVAAGGEPPTGDRQSPITGGRSSTGDRRSPRDHGWLCLPTGGTSGTLRLARHDQDTLAAAVRGCAAHFEVSRINAVGVLPLHHVSGLMAWMRCALTGGRYVRWAWEDLEVGRWPDTGPGDWFLSLVPTQLQRLLDQPTAAECLRRFRAVLVGGGPVWSDLLDRAAAARLPLAPGYGMTETAAMVSALRPEEFLAGRRGCGSALPHARVELGTDGGIALVADSLFRGYYPHWREPGPWQTEDLGRWDEHGGLHVLGRRDAVIITGGEKVEPGEVEAALRATGEFADVAVIGLPDATWGEAVVACYPAGAKEPDLRAVGRHVVAELAPHKRPKHYLCLAVWPRSEQGKVNRRELTAQAQEATGRIMPSGA
ncbi:MAG TPA: AMP-binding protein [Opitutaceae bacterium]|nr:AMP-binding protein [Opitutaceae bacterium]